MSKIRQRGNLESHGRPVRAGSCVKGNPKSKHGQGGQCLKPGTGLRNPFLVRGMEKTDINIQGGS